ncbi:hypothetical protein X758_08145 [Mesorhizobium sp. LSHC416B00]|nr:hypothetical protein X758_08145 [Mesorhizobium sp. LSHC416B00]
MTEAIGTQKLALPSSVCHAALATGEKFSMPGSEDRSARLPFLNSSSDLSNGRQGDQVASRAGGELGAECGVILGRRRRCEHHFDARVLGLKSRDQLVLPDGKVVAAPAFDIERYVIGVSQPGGAENAGAEKQCRQ